MSTLLVSLACICAVSLCTKRAQDEPQESPQHYKKIKRDPASVQIWFGPEVSKSILAQTNVDLLKFKPEAKERIASDVIFSEEMHAGLMIEKIYRPDGLSHVSIKDPKDPMAHPWILASVPFDPKTIDWRILAEQLRYSADQTEKLRNNSGDEKLFKKTIIIEP